jgi:hypothetical protein
MEFHAIIPGRPAELLMRVVDGKVVIMPPTPPATIHLPGRAQQQLIEDVERDLATERACQCLLQDNGLVP